MSGIDQEEGRVGAEFVHDHVSAGHDGRSGALEPTPAGRRRRSGDASSCGRHDLDSLLREVGDLGAKLLEPGFALVQVPVGDFLTFGQVEVGELILDLV